MQRMLAFACLVAGVFVLLGFGWALLAAGTVLWVRDDRAAEWLTSRTGQLRSWLSSVVSMPRRAIAGASMGVGLVVAPIGAATVAGVGVGILVAGALLVSFGVFSGWGA